MQLLAHGRDGGRLARLEALEVDEVGDHLDRAFLHVEFAFGFAGQPGAGRGEQVLALDREPGELVEAALHADQGDVGAVQGAGEGDVELALLAQHLAGHPGGLGVRNGVVAVDDLHAPLFDQLDQLVGQVERIGRMAEERDIR